MDRQAQAVIVAGRLDAAARQAYAVAFGARCDTSGGLASMDAELSQASLFDVVVAGQVVMRYALKTVRLDKGVETYIVAAAGAAPGVDLVQAITPFIETQCPDSDCLTVHTRRRGLVKKLGRQGWTLDAYVLRKKIK